MDGKGKKKAELIKELETLKKDRGGGMLENNITKRKQAEKVLAESEEKFLITLKNSPIVVWNQDKDLRYTWIYNPNPGFKPEETIGKTDKELLPADDAEKLMHIKRKVLESGIGAREETKVTIQGNDYYYDLTVEPLLDSNNAIIGITCVAIDITECKQAEEALRLHVVMMDNVAEGIYLVGLDDLLIKWTNEKFASMFGYDPGELVGKQVDIVNAFTEKTPTKTRIDIVDVLKKTGKWQGEVRNIKRDGTHFWCHANVSLFDHPEYGKVIVSVHTDITKRKQAEERIKHLNLVLRAIRGVNQLIVKEKDREKLIKGACNNLVKTRGYYSSWIVLLDEEGKLNTYVEAGLGKAFLPMVERFKEGKLTACGQKTIKQEDMIIIEDPLSTCADCPLAQEYSGRGTMTIRLGREGKIYGVMSVSVPADFITDKEEQALFIEIAKDISLGLHSIEMRKKMNEQTRDLKQNYKRTKRAMDTTIQTMSKIVEAKDPYTSGHQKRVSQLATAIAKELNLPKDKTEGIRIASIIHDIGKVSIPTEILSKPTTLSDIEFSLIKSHSQIGYNILKSIDFTYPVAQIVLHHHERINGSGYPNQLKGDKILLEAKIIGVADVVEAMSSHRPYRPALGIDVALDEIIQNKGILYDPEVVAACVKLFREKGFKFE